MRHHAPSRTRAAGFTLVELLIVLAIIGILMGFILVAAQDGIRRAEERATQSLVVKLETALSDRLEALMTQSVDPNLAHYILAQPYTGAGPLASVIGNKAVPGDERAEALARIDMIKAEMPDVFFKDPNNADYPINFAAQPYFLPWSPGTNPVSGNHFAYVLPLGQMTPIAQGGADPTSGALFVAGTGIYGASYALRAALNTNLGYGPQGVDQVDNNGNGLIDEVAESGLTQQQVLAKLANHKHETARAEALYALLVENKGPLGSVFSRDDFTDREVQDTDNDGLPEFVDSWGNPIQFYRWPVYYHSDIQKGYDPYFNTLETRERCPLDGGNVLVSPSWWGNFAGGNPNQPSAQAQVFHNFFFSLLDPLASQSSSSAGVMWDRGGYYQRRAFFTRFLVASAGPDGELGIAQAGKDYDGDGNFELPISASNLLLIENQAANFDPQIGRGRQAGNYKLYEPVPGSSASAASQAVTTQLIDAGFDDITSQNVQSGGGGLR